jgi:hypothetical protein
MDKARSMLNGYGLAQELWAEVVETTIYLLNMSPSSVLFNITPHELWSGKKPSMVDLKVFGCDAFVHIPKEKRSKMDKNTFKCISLDIKKE